MFATGAAIWAVVAAALSLVYYAIAPAGVEFSGTRETLSLALLALLALAPQTFAQEFIFRGWLTQRPAAGD